MACGSLHAQKKSLKYDEHMYKIEEEVKNGKLVPEKDIAKQRLNDLLAAE